MERMTNEYEQWVVVTETFGALEAEFIVGRLKAEEIPARMWTESAGRALGITIGKLGTSYVEVPVSFLEEAKEIIDEDFSNEIDDDEWQIADNDLDDDLL